MAVQSRPLNKLLKYFCFILLLNLSIPAQTVVSQTDVPEKYVQFGIGWPVLPVDNYSLMSPSICFKKIFSKHVLRAGLIGLIPTGQFKNVNEFVINVGYEKRFLKNKFQILAGFDIGYYTYTGQDFYVKNFGMGPVLGFIYKLSDRIELQTELGFFLGPATSKNPGSPIIDHDARVTGTRGFSIYLYYNSKKH